MQTLNILDNRFSEFNTFNVFKSASFDKNKRGLLLLEQLQTTLDISQLLNKFAIEASKYVNFSGLRFISVDSTTNARGSREAKIEKQFELFIENEFLGTLTYSINKPMHADDASILSELHTYLLNPFRNAIAYQRALTLAMQDGLTGLGNRRYFDEQLTRAVNQAKRQNNDVGLVLCDLNKFKIINDTYGHHVGDKVLQHFSTALKNSIRGSDSVFRFGGDEFAILVEDASRESLEVIHQRIDLALDADPVLAKYKVGSSLGATFLHRTDTTESFFERADQALYSKKMNMPQKLTVV